MTLRADKEGNANVVPLAHYLDLRRRPKLYGQFCGTFLRCVVGDSVWRGNHLHKPLGDFVTPSDEAFALLLIENSYERWIDMWENDNKKTSDVPAKYTNAGVSNKDGRTRKYCGWSKPGVTRFNELNLAVGRSRQAFPTFDKDLLTAWQLRGKPHNGSNKENKDTSEPVVAPATDFPWDAAQATLQSMADTEHCQQTIIDETSSAAADSDADDG